MGSYSFLPTKAFNENPVHWDHLCAPVTPPPNPMNPYEAYNYSSPLLWFAGEAYDDKYTGLLQGAYNCGWQTGIEIVRKMKAEREFKKQQEENLRKQEEAMMMQYQQYYQQ